MATQLFPVLPEELIPLSQVPKLDFIPRRRRGKKMHLSTPFRWAQVGLRGVRLQTIQFGGTKCTTRSMLRDFFSRLADANSPNSRHPEESQQPRDRSIELRLQEEGL
jgi:hypothetical protein